MIARNKLYVNMLDVTVTDANAATNEQVVTVSEAVPISRVYLELGFKGGSRHLESAAPETVFSQQMVTDAGRLVGGGGIPGLRTERDDRKAAESPYVTRFTVEASISSDATSILEVSGPQSGVEKIALHEQIGPDFLWLGNQAVLEIYRIIENGTFTRFGLVYLRPVTNILYRDGAAFPVAKTLEHMVL